MSPNQVKELIRDLQNISRAARTAEEELIESLEQQVIARVLPLYERARRECHDEKLCGPISPLRSSLVNDLDAITRSARDLCDGWASEAEQYRREIAKLRDTLAAIEGVA